MKDKAHSLKRTAKVLIVDDHPLVREGLAVRMGTQPDLEVCGEAASADEALRQVEQSVPDLVVVDIRLEGSSGIALIEQIAERFPSVKMLVVSAYEERLYAQRALRAGAHGYINKRECQTKVLDAIRTVLRGHRYVSPAMSDRLIDQAVSRKDDSAGVDLVERLSDRELEVFQLIGQGKTTRAIARQLEVSVHTIDSYREKLRHKLNVKNGAELTQRAIQWVLENG